MILDHKNITPKEFAQVAQNVRKTFYWEKKDLATYVVLTKHLLATAIENHKNGGEFAEAFRGRVLGLGYDLASMTWPGWDEDGIDMTEEFRKDGLAASKYILDLAISSKAPVETLFNSYWIYGAHLLTDKNNLGAIGAWQKCAELKPDDDHIGVQSWIMLAKAVDSGDFGPINAELERLTALPKPNPGIAAQIQTALKVVSKNRIV